MPEAVNLLAMLAGTDGTDKEIFLLTELDWFILDRNVAGKAGAKFIRESKMVQSRYKHASADILKPTVYDLLAQKKDIGNKDESLLSLKVNWFS